MTNSAGTTRVTIPTTTLKDVKLAGSALLVQENDVIFDHPLDAPGTLEFVTDSGCRGGALNGPLLVKVEPAPIELNDWRKVGLASWSGGIE